MHSRTVIHTFILLTLLFSSACTTVINDDTENKDGPVPILGTLSGDLPVSALNNLPEGQSDQAVGYLDSQQQLDNLLQSIQAGGKSLPVVDFSSQIVLFTKNTVFYNRLSIAQVLRKGDALTILAMETMSAMPITDKVAISLAVIKRDDVQFIEAGGQRLVIGD